MDNPVSGVNPQHQRQQTTVTGSWLYVAHYSNKMCDLWSVQT